LPSQKCPYGTIAKAISPHGHFLLSPFSQRRQIYGVLPRSSSEVKKQLWDREFLTQGCYIETEEHDDKNVISEYIKVKGEM
jgi:hypothetical protein